MRFCPSYCRCWQSEGVDRSKAGQEDRLRIDAGGNLWQHTLHPHNTITQRARGTNTICGALSMGGLGLHVRPGRPHTRPTWARPVAQLHTKKSIHQNTGTIHFFGTVGIECLARRLFFCSRHLLVLDLKSQEAISWREHLEQAAIDNLLCCYVPRWKSKGLNNLSNLKISFLNHGDKIASLLHETNFLNINDIIRHVSKSIRCLWCVQNSPHDRFNKRYQLSHYH